MTLIYKEFKKWNVHLSIGWKFDGIGFILSNSEPTVYPSWVFEVRFIFGRFWILRTNKSINKMAEELPKKPSEEVQKITDADPPYRNCTVCGLWLAPGEIHNHERTSP